MEVSDPEIMSITSFYRVGGGGDPRDPSPQANYTDRATAACQRS
jgi:hypothetical protein